MIINSIKKTKQLRSCLKDIDRTLNIAKENNITLCKAFLDDVEFLKNGLNTGIQFDNILFYMKHYTKKIISNKNLDKSLALDGSYFLRHDGKVVAQRVIKFNEIQTTIKYNDDLAKEIAQKNINFNYIKNKLSDKAHTKEEIDTVVYEAFKDGLTKKALYQNTNFQHLRLYIVNNLFNYFKDLTKNDTEVKRETLLNNEVIQALSNSISKFIELYYQQPQELKHILLDYKETPLKDYIAVTENAINNSDDIKLLDKIFPTYKRDEQHRIYNYDLFAFLYYVYSLKISFEHLYNSKLLKSLGAYRYTKNRDKPSLKTDVLKRFSDGKRIAFQFQCENNIYIENFEKFIKNAELKKINLYILSFLVDMSHNITESKNFLQLITAKDNYHKINYENLPIPINTLLLQPQQIAN